MLALPGSDPQEVLGDWLAQRIGRLLQLAPDQVARDRPLTWQGFDSLMGLELEQALAAELQVVAPSGLLQSGPSIDQVVEAVLPLLPDRPPGPEPAAPSAPEGLLPSLTGTRPDGPAPTQDVAPLPLEGRVLLAVLLVATLGIAWWMWA